MVFVFSCSVLFFVLEVFYLFGRIDRGIRNYILFSVTCRMRC